MGDLGDCCVCQRKGEGEFVSFGVDVVSWLLVLSGVVWCCGFRGKHLGRERASPAPALWMTETAGERREREMTDIADVAAPDRLLETRTTGNDDEDMRVGSAKCCVVLVVPRKCEHTR